MIVICGSDMIYDNDIFVLMLSPDTNIEIDVDSRSAFPSLHNA